MCHASTRTPNCLGLHLPEHFKLTRTNLSLILKISLARTSASITSRYVQASAVFSRMYSCKFQSAKAAAPGQPLSTYGLLARHSRPNATHSIFYPQISLLKWTSTTRRLPWASPTLRWLQKRATLSMVARSPLWTNSPNLGSLQKTTSWSDCKAMKRRRISLALAQSRTMWFAAVE